MPDMTYELERVHGHLRFVTELLTDFYSTQIDAGAVTREEVAQHIRAAAERAVAGAHTPANVVDQIWLEAEGMVTALPAGWASGDDWQEPA